MDLLTQGLLGGAVAQTGAPPHETRAATAVGLLAGLLPDADTLIRSPHDPLLFLDFHRHFTHSLVFIPVVALIAALLAWPVLKRRVAFRRVCLYAMLGVAFAGLLDACTSYGTRLFWPFSDEAVALGIVSIVDPVITVALATGISLGLRRQRPRPARVALVIVVAYLGVGAWQHNRALESAQALALDRGQSPERLLVKPTLANVLLWRSLYVNEERIYADAVRVTPFGEALVYPGEAAPLLDGGVQLDAADPAAALGPALPRFARFADGLTVRHPQRPEFLGDARYAMLPTSLRPLWGVVPARKESPYPARFVTDRSMSREERRRFVAMLLGKDLN